MNLLPIFDSMRGGVMMISLPRVVLTRQKVFLHGFWWAFIYGAINARGSLLIFFSMCCEGGYSKNDPPLYHIEKSSRLTPSHFRMFRTLEVPP